MTTIASSDTDGPLVGGIDALTALDLAATNPQALAQYVNPALQHAERSLPEGAEVELDITGWQVAGQSIAQFVASRLNANIRDIRDPDTGEQVQPWPQYPDQIAWGDDSTDTLTLRWVKGQPFAVWIIVGIVVLAGIWYLLSRAKWRASANVVAPGTPNPVSIGAWIVDHWWLFLILAAAGVAAPFIVRSAAKTEEAVNELRAAERGAY